MSLAGFHVCFNGPEEALTKTLNAQPALYACGAIAANILMDKGVTPYAAAGHSLGEYTALYAAGVFDFITGLRLVKARAESMNRAAENTKGTMAAIIGLKAAQGVLLSLLIRARDRFWTVLGISFLYHHGINLTKQLAKK